MKKNKFISKKGKFSEILMHKLYSKKIMSYLSNSIDSGVECDFDINDYLVKSNNILDEKLKVNNVSKPIIIQGIEEMGLEKIDDSYDYLLRMPIYSLTKELFEKLKEDFTAKKADIKKLEETDPKDMYLDDLNELKKKFK